MPDHAVTIYTRDPCHLCEEAKAVVERVAADVDAAVTVEAVDVDADPDLADRYGERVPYVLVDGRPAFKYRVEEAALRARFETGGEDADPSRTGR